MKVTVLLLEVEPIAQANNKSVLWFKVSPLLSILFGGLKFKIKL